LSREADGSPRALPIVEDWGPRFQKIPSQPGALVSPDTLLAVRASFDACMSTARARRKTNAHLAQSG
jgi:hypothetical protein